MLQKKIISSCLIAAVLGPLCLTGPALAENDVEISGSAGLRIKSEGQKNGRLNQETALKVETKRSKRGLKAVTKLEADTSDLLVRVESGYFDLKLSDTTKLRGGLQKKEIGLESSQGSKSRTAPFKSRTLSQLELWGYSGKYNQLKLRREIGNHEITTAIGSANSHDSFVTFQFETPLTDWLYAGIWLLGQADRVDNGYQKAAVGNLSLSTDFDLVNAELEVTEGTNPHETEYQKTYGDGTHIRFNYARFMLSVNSELFGVSTQPFIQYEFLRKDHTNPYNNSLTYTGGVNFLAARDLKISVACQSEGIASGPDQKKRHWSVQQTLAQAVYYFN